MERLSKMWVVLLIIIFYLIWLPSVYAFGTAGIPKPKRTNPEIQLDTGNLIQNRMIETDAALNSPFAVVFYKPNYLLPFYNTGSTYNSVYAGYLPENKPLNHKEVKFQLSVMLPVWENIMGSCTSLMTAYTQLSYWQPYRSRGFVRETDYEPEVFLSNQIDYPIWNNFKLNLLNLGFVHQSNGFGTELERAWNRLYLSCLVSSENWLLILRPWFVLRDATYKRQNSDLAHYLGYEEITIAYKYLEHVVSLETRNTFESSFKRAGLTLSWSFPLVDYVKGYVQLFNGYGQSLIEYNHRTTSVGVGISLSHFI